MLNFYGLIFFFFLQVEKAFEHLVAYNSEKERDVRFQVTCGVNNMKGIYMRGGLQEKPRDYGISVEPIFLDSENMGLLFIFIIELEQRHLF